MCYALVYQNSYYHTSKIIPKKLLQLLSTETRRSPIAYDYASESELVQSYFIVAY